MAEENTVTKKYTFGLDKNFACALSYVAGWISGLVFFLSEKEDKEIRFHAVQSIIFFGSLSIISLFLGRIPLVGWSLMPVLGLLVFVGWLVCLVKAYQGEHFKLPVVGDIAEKQVNK